MFRTNSDLRVDRLLILHLLGIVARPNANISLDFLNFILLSVDIVSQPVLMEPHKQLLLLTTLACYICQHLQLAMHDFSLKSQ